MQIQQQNQSYLKSASVIELHPADEIADFKNTIAQYQIYLNAREPMMLREPASYEESMDPEIMVLVPCRDPDFVITYSHDIEVLKNFCRLYKLPLKLRID